MTQPTISKTGVAAELEALSAAIRAKCHLDLLSVAFKDQVRADISHAAWVRAMHDSGMTSDDISDAKRPERNILFAEWGDNRLADKRDRTIFKVHTKDLQILSDEDKRTRTLLHKRAVKWLAGVVSDLKRLEGIAAGTIAADTGTGANTSGKAKYGEVEKAVASLHTGQRLLGKAQEKRRENKEDLNGTEVKILAAFTKTIDDLCASDPVIKTAFKKFASGNLIGKISITAKQD
jgi:hypothetical protein